MLSSEFTGGLGFGRRSAFIIFAAVLLFSGGNYLFNGFYAGMKYKGGDFLNYYALGKLMMQGVNIHDEDERESAVAQERLYIEGETLKKHHQPDYPPFWYLFMWVFTGVRWEFAFYLWTVLNQFFLFFTVLLLYKYFEVKFYSLESAALIFIILNFYPLYYGLMEGQVNILLLLLIIWSLWLFKRGNEWGAGLLLGLTVGIKLVPAFILFYFLWKGHWKVVIFGAVGFAGTILISIAGAGQEIVVSYFTHQLPKYGGGLRPEIFNQSINGFVSRLFTVSDASNGWFDSAQAGNLLTKILSGIVFILTLVFTYGRDKRGSSSWNLGLCVFILAMLMISSWTMEHHFIFLYIPFAVVLLGYIREEGVRISSAVITLFIFAILAVFIPYTSEKFNSGLLILVKSLKFYPLVVMWGLLYFERKRIGVGVG